MNRPATTFSRNASRIAVALLVLLVAGCGLWFWQRYQAATGSLPEALYHLVARDRVARYSTMAAALCHADAALAITGPWPPFAFAPEML